MCTLTASLTLIGILALVVAMLVPFILWTELTSRQMIIACRAAVIGVALMILGNTFLSLNCP